MQSSRFVFVSVSKQDVSKNCGQILVKHFFEIDPSHTSDHGSSKPCIFPDFRLVIVFLENCRWLSIKFSRLIAFGTKRI